MNFSLMEQPGLGMWLCARGFPVTPALLLSEENMGRGRERKWKTSNYP